MRARRFRSAITGRIVKAATAKRHPDTTVAEDRLADLRADARAELERLRDLERACRRLRQTNLAGVLAAAEHRDAGSCEVVWRDVARYIDRPARRHG